jgi:hypothetical protein
LGIGGCKMIKPGDYVLCRFFNKPDNRFYGDYFRAKVLEVIKPYTYASHANAKFLVDKNGYKIVLHRKEIKKCIT